MNTEESKEDEIDLMEMVKQLWRSKKMITKIVFGFLTLGVLAALLSSNSYTASSTFIPQSSSGSTSSLSGVASLVGINLGGMDSGSEIPTSIYPEIIKSVSFKRELLAANISANKLPIKTLKEFLLKKNQGSDIISTIKKYTISLPFTILAAIKGVPKKTIESSSNLLVVSLEEEELFKVLDGDLINLSVNLKDGFVTISSTTSDASKAAYTVLAAQEILQKTIIDYKIQSAKELLSFNKRELALKKIEFDSVQNKLAHLKDSNLNIIDSRLENEISKVQSEFQIVQAVYQELSKQLEQSKLQVSKDTPIFSVIKPVTIPNKKSSKRRYLTVLSYGFFGFILSCGFVLTKGLLLSFFKELKA